MDRTTGARSRATTSALASARALAREWVLPVAIGAAALVLDQVVKLPLQIPGKNGVLWIGGLVLARLVSRNGLGASAAGVGGMLAASSSDPIAGLEIAVAGLVLDVALVLARTDRWLALALLGAACNGVVLAIKLATGSAPNAVAVRGIGFTILSYLLYGAIGGALASVLHATGARIRHSRLAAPREERVEHG